MSYNSDYDKEKYNIVEEELFMRVNVVSECVSDLDSY